MKEHLPQFKPVQIKSQYLWPGERSFLWIPREPIHIYVVLSPSLKGYDEFSVDIGWSLLGRFPEIGARGARTPTSDHFEFKEDEFACRVTSLYSGEDEFWKLYDEQILMDDPMSLILSQAQPLSKDQAEKIVLPKVHDAMDKLLKYGVPYLNEFVEYIERDKAVG